MTLAAILSVVAIRAIGAYVSGVVFIVAFRDFVCLFVVAGSTIFITRHAFHVSSFLTFMMAGCAGFPHVLADVDLVIEVYHATVCIKLDCLRKGRHDEARFLKCKALANMACIAAGFHGHGLMAFDAIRPYKVRVGLVLTLKLQRLSKIVAGAAVHFDVGWNSLVFFFIIMMAVIAPG